MNVESIRKKVDSLTAQYVFDLLSAIQQETRDVSQDDDNFDARVERVIERLARRSKEA